MRKRQVLKDLRLRTRFSEEQNFKKFGTTLKEVVHSAFHIAKRIISIFIFWGFFFLLEKSAIEKSAIATTVSDDENIRDCMNYY